MYEAMGKAMQMGADGPIKWAKAGRGDWYNPFQT